MDSLHCEATQHSSNTMFMTPTGSDFIANGDFDDNSKNKGSSEKKATKIKIKKPRKTSTNEIGNKIMETVFMDKIKESIVEVSGEGKEPPTDIAAVVIPNPAILLIAVFKLFTSVQLVPFQDSVSVKAVLGGVLPPKYIPLV